MLIGGCIKDKGNYDYDYLPDVTVTNMAEENEIIVKYGEELHFIPIIETDIPSNELSFVWYLQYFDTRDTISTERSIKRIADMNSGRLYLEIKHDPSNVRWLSVTYLTVIKPFQKGWALLTKEGSRSHINFMEQITLFNFNYLPKLYYQQNGSYLPIDCQEIVSSDRADLWLVRSENEVHLLNDETMKPVKLMSEMLHNPIANFSPSHVGFSLTELSSGYRFMVANGKFYSIPFVTSIPPDIDYMYDLPAEGDYFISNKLASIATKQVLAFDEIHQRYLWYIVKPGRITATIPSVDKNSLPITPGKLDKECVWMGNLKYGSGNGSIDVCSILKDETDKYEIQLLGGKDYNLILRKVVDIPASVINDDTKIAFNNVNGNILFYQNNNVHLFNSSNSTFTERWKTFSENILHLTVFDDYVAVATARGTNSHFTLLKGNLELANQTVNGQIIGMSYKER